MSSPKSGAVSPPSPPSHRDDIDKGDGHERTHQGRTNYLAEKEEKQLLKAIKGRKGGQDDVFRNAP